MPSPQPHCKPSLLKKISPELWEKLSEYSGRYFYNRPSVASVEIAEMKIDEERPWPKIDLWRAQAQRCSDRMLEVPLTAQSYTDQETLDHLDLKKGCSLPWKLLGFKTRKSLYESEIWKKVRDDPDALEDLLPFYESCGKEELADWQDFLDQKVRTFQTTSAHLLYWQIRLFGRGNENLKNYRWSKYGFNPFYGGADKWYREITIKDEHGQFLYKIRICWDISGYDRKIYLTFVAIRRLKCWIKANPNSPHLRIAEWVARAWIQSILVFINGDVVIRTRGNNSGSGTTTTNNIEAGFEVCSDLLSFVYYTKFGFLPNDELIIDQLIALFGDDNAMYLMECFSFMTDDKLVKDRLYSQHGLVCKWLIGGVEHPMGDLPFLGFTFSSYKAFFIPKWNIKRLVHPILYTPTKKNIGQYLQQVYALLVMSFAHEHAYKDIRLVYIKLLQYYSDSGAPDVKVMLKLGIPTDEEIEQFYLGFENSSSLPLIWDIGGGGPKFNFMNSREANIDSSEGNLVNCMAENTFTNPFLGWLTWRKNNPHLAEGQDFKTYAQGLMDIEECQISPLPVSRSPGVVQDHRGQKRFEGSFNPYGNQMLAAMINFFAPTFRTASDGTWECFSTVTVDGKSPVAIFGRGETQEDSYDEWMSEAMLKFSVWMPVTPLSRFFKLLLTIPPPPQDHPLRLLWNDTTDHTLGKILEGSFNPYGNGQPMSKAVYMARNKASFDREKLTQAARNQRFEQYLSKSRKKGGPLNTVKQDAHNKISPNQKMDRRTARNQMAVREVKLRNNMYLRNQLKGARNVFDGISECAKYYYVACVCPFWWVDESCDLKLKTLGLNSDEKKNPCIPLIPNLKSRKTYFFNRGNFSVSPLGAEPGSANICFAPRRLANGGAQDGYGPPVIISTNLLVTTLGNPFLAQLDTNLGLPVGFSGVYENGDYSAADLVALNNRGIKYRLVGAGLRVRYTGAEVARAGTLHCITTPNHDTLASLNFNSAGNFETYFKMPITREWVTLTHMPVLEEDFQFRFDKINNPALVTDPQSFDHYIGFWVSNCANGSFEYEAISHFEITGDKVRGITPTPVDTSGVSVVVNSATASNLPEINQTKNIGSLLKTGLDLVSTFVPEAKIVKDVVSVAGDLMTSFK